MVGIICALKFEAAPIIRHFKLLKDKENNRFELYTNNEIALLVSGIGMIRASAATSFMCQKLKNSNMSLLNIGICGSLNKNTAIGEAILANKITNTHSKKNFYPDILIKHSFIEGELHTYSSPVNLNNINTEFKLDSRDKIFIDMEGAGFFESSAIFLPPHKIFCIKVVSDIVSPCSVSPNLIENIIFEKLNVIEEFINNLKQITLKDNSFSEEEKSLIKKTSEKLKLTFAQYYQLENLCLYRKSCMKTLDILNHFTNHNIKEKSERRKIFEQLKQDLSS